MDREADVGGEVDLGHVVDGLSQPIHAGGSVEGSSGEEGIQALQGRGMDRHFRSHKTVGRPAEVLHLVEVGSAWQSAGVTKVVVAEQHEGINNLFQDSGVAVAGIAAGENVLDALQSVATHLGSSGQVVSLGCVPANTRPIRHENTVLWASVRGRPREQMARSIKGPWPAAHAKLEENDG